MKRIQGFTPILALGIALSAGCAQAPSLAPRAQAPVAVQDVRSMEAHHQKIIQTLGLTQAQLAQLKSIKQNYKAKLMDENKDELKQEFKDLFLAKDVDEVAFKNFLVERKDAWNQKLPIIANQLSEMRAVLTEEQRNKLVELLNAMDFGKIHQKKQEKIMGKLLKDLNLTTAQEEALDALKDKIDAAHTPEKIAAMKSALIAFIQTGNENDLVSTISEHMSEAPIDQVVTFVGSLTQEQRTTILSRVEAWKAKMKEMKEMREKGME